MGSQALDIVRPTDSYFYKIDGLDYVRVTWPLGYWVPPQLKGWFIKNTAKAIEERKTSTADQGSAIHRAAHENKEDRLTTLLASMGAKKIDSEFIVYSKNGWAGQVDLLVEMQAKNYLLDIKTGRFGQVFAQLGAYSLGANERGYNIQGVGVISLPRDETKPAQFFDYSEHMEEGQIQYCELYDYWKFDNYKELKDWHFFKGRSVFSYEWSEKAKRG